MRATLNGTTGLGVLAATTALTVAAVGTATARSEAAPAPAFLATGELPPDPASDWNAGEVTAGLPEVPVFCLEDALPERRASHRQFWTDLDTNAVQVTVVTRSDSAARRLAAMAESSVRNCARDWEQQVPGGTAEWRDFGTMSVEEGAHVYGVGISNPETADDVHLFGVGRDGHTVTVVRWGRMGTFEQADPAAFRATTRTAVDKLYD
ncbi:hypothetical protein [Streptomyces meridianus]|uniref:Sensor domain-containing protein n=1 Tax=Streptomyces meridianus TaxID=2938945 RepID=A0ABT0XAV7_9ACTN|nr:hypothetical protein [Streptomyces meridianus]MCM2579539.1 hypothetical protein [Streptomyces meridianus]